MKEINYKGHLIVENDGIYNANYFCIDGSTICDTFESIEEAKTIGKKNT